MNYKIIMGVLIGLTLIPFIIAINIYFVHEPEIQQVPIQVTQPAQDQ